MESKNCSMCNFVSKQQFACVKNISKISTKKIQNVKIVIAKEDQNVIMREKIKIKSTKNIL